MPFESRVKLTRVGEANGHRDGVQVEVLSAELLHPADGCGKLSSPDMQHELLERRLDRTQDREAGVQA